MTPVSFFRTCAQPHATPPPRQPASSSPLLTATEKMSARTAGWAGPRRGAHLEDLAEGAAADEGDELEVAEGELLRVDEHRLQRSHPLQVLLPVCKSRPAR